MGGGYPSDRAASSSGMVGLEASVGDGIAHVALHNGHGGVAEADFVAKSNAQIGLRGGLADTRFLTNHERELLARKGNFGQVSIPTIDAPEINLSTS